MEYFPQFYGRFSSKRFFDRLVTFGPVYKILSFGKKRLYGLSNGVIVNGIDPAIFIKKLFKITEKCVIYDCIDIANFYITDNKTRNAIVFNYPINMNEARFLNIKKILDTVSPKIIYVLGKPPNTNFIDRFNIKTVVETNYTYERLIDIYSQSLFSIIPEDIGTFELIPIESIASGVPVIGFKSPSLSILEEILLKLGTKSNPFLELDENSFKKVNDWLDGLLTMRQKLSQITREAFSQEEFAEKILKCVENNID